MIKNFYNKDKKEKRIFICTDKSAYLYQYFYFYFFSIRYKSFRKKQSTKVPPQKSTRRPSLTKEEQTQLYNITKRGEGLTN